MYELKTKVNDNSVVDFLNTIENGNKKEDAFKILEIFKKVTKLKPKMWGESMVGFGTYKYKYASGHEGEYFQTGFSPRKTNFSLYIEISSEEGKELLSKLGKVKNGKSCVYVNKLSDIDVDVLKKLIVNSIV